MKYSVKLLIKSTTESGEVSIEESILMMDADSFDDAYDKAERYVETLGVCEPYVNIFGKRVDVEVVSYADCFRIDDDEADEVTEVYSSIACPNAKTNRRDDRCGTRGFRNDERTDSVPIHGVRESER